MQEKKQKEETQDLNKEKSELAKKVPVMSSNYLFCCLFIYVEQKLTPGSGIQIKDGKNRDPGSGKNIPDLKFENFFGLRILTFLDADPYPGDLVNPGSGIRDGKVGSGVRDGKVGSGINIPDPQHCFN